MSLFWFTQFCLKNDLSCHVNTVCCIRLSTFSLCLQTKKIHFCLTLTDLTVCFSFACSQEGQRLIQEKPELSSLVKKKVDEIRECWQDLESTTQAKARQLFEANRADLLVQSYSSLDQRLEQLEGQLAHVDYGQDLTTVNKHLKKLQVYILLYICLLFFYIAHQDVYLHHMLFSDRIFIFDL